MEDQAYQTALRYLERRETSEQGLASYLGRKGFEEAPIAAAIERLVRLGYIDDRRWARLMVREGLRQRRGENWVRQKVRQKKARVTEEELKEWFSEEASAMGVTPAEEARRYVERRYDTSLFKKDFAARQKAMAALVRRGYSFDQARTAVVEAGTRLEPEEVEE